MRGLRAFRAIVFLASLGMAPATGAADASDDRIVTDRPDAVESSDVVGKGRFQIETSVDYERDSRAGVKTRTLTTPTLFRLGVSDSIELRLETDGRVRERTDTGGTSETQRGWADTAIGFVWHMQDFDEKTRAPSIGWLVRADLATGSNGFRSGGVRPSVRIVFEWELPADFSLGVMPGVIYDRDPATGERYTAGILAAGLGKELNDRTRVFGELAATQIARQEHGGTIVTFNTGVAWLLTRNAQLDFSVRLGLNSRSPDSAVAAGVSVRF